MPRRHASGRTRPAPSKASSNGSPARAISSSGPVQLTIRRTRSRSSAPPPRGRQVTIAAAPSGSAPRIRPAAKRRRPSACKAAMRSATAGAIRWRWTSHQGRKCRMKRRRSASGARLHRLCTACRTSCTASRQPIASPRRRTARSRPTQSSGKSSSGGGEASRFRLARGTSPRRDKAWIRPVKPSASSVSAASIAVRPVPISRTSSVSRSPSARSPNQGSST